MKLKRIVIIAALILFHQFAAAATLDTAAIDAAALEEMTASSIPGAALVLVRGDETVLVRGWGVASADTGEPVTGETLFRLGSTTKIFVGLAAAVMAEAGELDLDAPIGQAVPELHASLRKLTLHQLLTHTAGLADDAPMQGPRDESALGDRVLRWDGTALFAPPGEICSYSNPGYVLAGYVLERIARKKDPDVRFADVVRSRVLDPLGMRQATFRPLEAMTRRLALGHDRKRDAVEVLRPQPEHAGSYPSGSLYASAGELALVLRALLNEGKLGERQALPARAVRRALTEHATIPSSGLGYGYGIIVRRAGEESVLSHPGARAGYGSAMLLLADAKVGGFVLGNRTGASPGRTAMRSIAMLAPIPPPAQPSDSAATEIDSSSIPGLYRNGDRSFRIEADGDALFLILGEKRLPVERTGARSFRAAGAGPLERFILIPDDRGVPRYLAAEVWAARRVE